MLIQTGAHIATRVVAFASIEINASTESTVLNSGYKLLARARKLSDLFSICRRLGRLEEWDLKVLDAHYNEPNITFWCEPIHQLVDLFSEPTVWFCKPIGLKTGQARVTSLHLRLEEEEACSLRY